MNCPSNKKLIFFFIVSVISSLILFGNVIGGDYVLDAHSVIEKREDLQSIKNWPGLFTTSWHPNSPWAGTYRPLTLVSFALNFLFSESAAGIHFIDIILHALNVVLIFYFVSMIMSERVGYMASAIFMFLPIHVEPVASLVGRVYLLSTFLGLLALIFFFRKRYFYSSIFMALALFSSESAISFYTLVGVFLLFENQSLVKLWKPGLIFLAPLPVYFILRFLALGQHAFSGAAFIDRVMGPLAFLSAKERAFTALSHAYIYLKKTFYPFDLTPDYYLNQASVTNNISSFPVLIGLLFIFVLVFILIRGSRNLKIASALCLIPYIFLSNLFFVASGTMAERFWYFPSLGLALAVSILLDRTFSTFSKSKRPFYLIGAIILVFYSFLIIKQNKVWLNDRNLYIHAAEISPGAWSHTNLAAIYFKEKKYELAREQAGKALDIYAVYPSALNIIGKIDWREKKYENAEDSFKMAIDSDTHGRNKRSLYRSLALMGLDAKQNKKALQYMNEALKWPVPAERENVRKGDEILLKIIEKIATSQRLTETEVQSLDVFYRVYRGF